MFHVEHFCSAGIGSAALVRIGSWIMDVVIVGAGGHGRVILDILRAAGQHRAVGYIDADPSLAGTTVTGLPVFGHLNVLPKLRQQRIGGAIVAIGDSSARISYARMLREHGFEMVNAIHPTATISPSATLGKNVVVAAHAVIGPDTSIADSCIINTASVVDHECQIHAGCHICPGAILAGRVQVLEGSFIGLGAKIIQCLTIGRQAIIGAGAVVIEEIPDGATAVGVPARVIRINDLSSAETSAELV